LEVYGTGTEIDVRRVVRYPPEIFVSAIPVDLVAGDNRIADYLAFTPYIVSLYGVSFARYDGLSFSVSVDGVTDVVKMEDLGAVKGLNYEEEVKVPSIQSMSLSITSPVNVSAYQLRHKVKVDSPNVLLKMMLGLTLKDRERELAEKYGLIEKLAWQTPVPYDPYTGVETIHSFTKTMTSSGTVLRIPVPRNRKVILLDIAADRPPASAQAYITVERDDVPDVIRVDPYCLQGLEESIGLWPKYPIRVVALDRLLIELDRRSGTHKIRIVYGVGKLTVLEKLKWDPDRLTDEERILAERLNLQDQIEAGVV